MTTEAREDKKDTPPRLSALEAAAREARGHRGLPPVQAWSPPDCGDIDLRIAADGSWHYMGSPIARPALVRLFSTILRRDGDRYVLVTPVEKVGIRVEDAPFTAVELGVEGEGCRQVLIFRTNVDDTARAGPAHPLRVKVNPNTGEPRPYVHIRAGLEALILRSVFYELVERAVVARVDGTAEWGVWSGGLFFPLGASAVDGAADGSAPGGQSTP